ncbi:MAG: hypothetical protein KKA55_10300 [Proteobacteria bacterium]|nr:hypothetical protein [Pseudomonadota bacterium]MBU1595908.1 hypothetical protein [Pseudomonadota bacterium]
MRVFALLLLAALLAPALPGPAQAGQARTRAQKARPPAAKAVEQPVLSQEELLSPYSALLRRKVGPQQAGGQGAGSLAPDSVQSNATSWKLDLSLKPQPRDDDSPLRFRLGRDTPLDPVTHEPLTPRADPLGAGESLRQLNLKDALDKINGKAEVQVDVLKF